MGNKSNNGLRGGLTKGPSHANGGIPGIVKDTGQPIEVEGGEIIINKAASKLHCEELSKINQSAGNGVAIPCDSKDVKDTFNSGGQISMFDFDNDSLADPQQEIVDALKLSIEYADEKEKPKLLKELSKVSKELNNIELDDFINNLKLKYLSDTVDKIIGKKTYQNTINQREQLLKWVKDPINNVKVIIAFSGGKDSVAMVLKALFIDKIPREQIELHHHEVDGEGPTIWDWPCTNSYCKAFAKHFGLKLLFSYAGGGITRAIFRQNELRQGTYYQEVPDGDFLFIPPVDRKDYYNTQLKFPAVENDLKKRWCSSVAKIEVLSKIITNSKSTIKDANILVMTGERRSESPNRSKYHEIEPGRNNAPGKNRNQIVWRSVIDYSEQEVWDLYEKHKIQPHPCYELGWNRCSCMLCIFNSPNTWSSANEIAPKQVAKIAEIESDLKKLGSPIPTLYLDYDKVPSGKFYKSGKKKGEPVMEKGRKQENIYECRVDKGTSFIPLEIKKRWAYEANNEFTSNIIVDVWKLPIGAKNTEQSGAT